MKTDLFKSFIKILLLVFCGIILSVTMSDWLNEIQENKIYSKAITFSEDNKTEQYSMKLIAERINYYKGGYRVIVSDDFMKILNKGRIEPKTEFYITKDLEVKPKNTSESNIKIDKYKLQYKIEDVLNKKIDTVELKDVYEEDEAYLEIKEEVELAIREAVKKNTAETVEVLSNKLNDSISKSKDLIKDYSEKTKEYLIEKSPEIRGFVDKIVK